MRTVHKLIPLFVTHLLLLLFLLLLIVIYVNLLVEFVVMSVSIRSPQEYYYTIIPSMYVQLGDAVDVLYDSIMLVRMNW